MTNSEIKFELSRLFESTVEDVFLAWTEPKQLQRWHAPGNVQVGEVKVDLQVGGYFSIEMLQNKDGELDSSTVSGQYIEIELNRRLVYTWGWQGKDRRETLVTIELLEKNGGTELKLKHQRFVDQRTCDKHGVGWGGCLTNLASWLNPFTKKRQNQC